MKKFNNNQSLVSIIMPMYDAALYVKQAIQSIQNQTLANWEMIVVDDFSQDKSYEIVKVIADRDQRIKLFRNKKNLGIGETVNKALKYAKAKYIARMDSDDIALPDRLEKQADFLKQNPDIGIVGSFMVEINEEDEITAVRQIPLTHDLIKKNMFVTQTIQNPTLMINKKMIPKDQLWYDGRFSPADDLDFFMRLLRYVKFANIPEYLMAYRKHRHNSSLKDIKKTFLLSVKIRLKAVAQYGYRPGLFQTIIQFFQSLVIIFLPNRFLYRIFQYWKNDRIKSDKPYKVNFRIIPKRKFSLSLVMPVYKAEDIIKTNTSQLIEFLDKQSLSYELILVADGMADKTYTIAKKLEKKYPNLKVYGYSVNRGKGYAVRFGIAKANSDYIGYMDAGSDISLTSLKQIIDNINSKTDIDAFIADKTHFLSLCYQIPFFRKIYSFIFIRLVNLLLSTSFTDTQTGLKIFRKKTIRHLISSLPINVNRFAFDVVLMKELCGKYNIYKCPVIITNEIRKSNVTFFDILQMAYDLIRISVFYRFNGVKLLSKLIPHSS